MRPHSALGDRSPEEFAKLWKQMPSEDPVEVLNSFSSRLRSKERDIC